MAEHDDVKTHQPFVPDETSLPEFTLAPVIVGAILGIVFGASSLYLVLKVGMTISASIPVAVISITLFRWLSAAFGLRKASILENNIVQTTGSAGESIAFGVGVTMPALMILGYEMEVVRVMTVASLGGLLGVLMMIPLRKGLIVKQHGKLTYPEGTACAEVLIVGEQGGTNAKTVFTGFFVGFLFKLANSVLRLWKDVPAKALGWYKGVEVAGEFAPELIGVGYIIGPATGCIMMAGGVLSTLVLIPLFKLFGDYQATPIYPATTLISAMTTSDVWKNYVLYIGAGAVAMGGIVSLFSSLPLIVSSFRAGLKDFGGGASGTRRTERDLPLTFVVVGSLALVAACWASPMLNVNLLGAILIVLFGFLFVTVSSRLTGEIGSSSNPISGMTVSTLLLTCLIFLMMGWTGAAYRLTALSIAAVVCIAASNGGTTSQDLKTGFLVGATPRHQQVAVLVGALTSALVIGWTLLVLNDASTIYVKPSAALQYRHDVARLPGLHKEKVRGPEAKFDDRDYFVLYLNEPAADLLAGKYLLDERGEVAYIVDPGINGTVKHRDADRRYVDLATRETGLLLDVALLKARERPYGPQAPADPAEYYVYQLEERTGELAVGKYLVDDAGRPRYFVDPGPTVIKYDSPKAKLMSLIIDGILTQKLPWLLVLVGAFISLTLELCRVSSLPFAVGVYLPFSASVPIFIGGLIRWAVDRRNRAEDPSAGEAESESSPGVLLSSGLIAGGAIAGIVIAILSAKYEALVASLDLSARPEFAAVAGSDAVAAGIFALLGFFLYKVGRRKLLG